uniref:Zinc finger, CCHC domain containing 17 n=1 Tax=Neogobius melanostomus TaxID=47308 RepID=A0A8C6T3E2_9GOBI
MSASRVENPEDRGRNKPLIYISFDCEKVKLSFSMKAVNHGTGRDLDPNNVNAEQDARRRRHFRDHTGNRITLEAGSTISFISGHFTKDCFSAPGLQYALLPEEDDVEPLQQTSASTTRQDSDKKKKKKKKRKRDRKDSESDSSSDSSSECKSKRQRHDREDKKKTKQDTCCRYPYLQQVKTQV